MKLICSSLITLALGLIVPWGVQAADSADMVAANVSMAQGASAGGDFEVVGGWFIEYVATSDPSRETCFGKEQNQCYYGTQVAQRRTGFFGELATVRRRVGSSDPVRDPSYGEETVCPRDTSALEFSDGYELDSGELIPGPATLCVRFN